MTIMGTMTNGKIRGHSTPCPCLGAISLRRLVFVHVIMNDLVPKPEIFSQLYGVGKAPFLRLVDEPNLAGAGLFLCNEL